MLAPYVKLANGLGVDKQNTTGEEVLTLHFEDDLYSISIYWDRVVFKAEGDISKFKKSNSVVDNPFFDIYNKIKGLQNFGATVNHLVHYVAIKPISNKEESEILKSFKEEYFNSNALKHYGDFNDACIITEQKDSNQEIKLEHGPYKENIWKQ